MIEPIVDLRHQLLVDRAIEKKYMTKKRSHTYICCEDLDFVWDEREVVQVEKMWASGLSLFDIARAFDRAPDEVALLIMDRARKGKIKQRKGGVFGCRQSNGI